MSKREISPNDKQPAEREKRLQEALRQNLKRRKAAPKPGEHAARAKKDARV